MATQSAAAFRNYPTIGFLWTGFTVTVSLPDGEKAWIHSETGLSEHNRRARFYSLTRGGTEQLHAEQESRRRFQQAVGRVLRRA